MKTYSIYVLRDRYDEPLYVGVTCALSNRVATHRRMKPWGGQISRVEVLATTEVPRERLRLERAAIEQLSPRYNISCTPMMAEIQRDAYARRQRVFADRHAAGIDCGDRWFCRACYPAGVSA